MRRTRSWILLVAALLAASLLASALVLRGRGGTVAEIVQDGRTLRTIDLSEVDEGYTFTVTGPAGTNRVEVEHGRIRVSHAQCPDQVCVRQGWIATGVVPIVCLPNALVIRIVDGETGGVDRTAG